MVDGSFKFKFLRILLNILCFWEIFYIDFLIYIPVVSLYTVMRTFPFDYVIKFNLELYLLKDPIFVK